MGQPRGGDGATGARRDRSVPALRVSGPRPRRRGAPRPDMSPAISAPSMPIWSLSLPTSWADLPASARWWCAGAFGSTRSWSAVSRNGPDGPGSRTWPPRWGSRRPLAALAATGTADAEEISARRFAGQIREAALAIPGVTEYGDLEHRVPHIVCLGIEGVEAEPILLGLDQAGIAAHSGSSCSSESLEPSPVLQAMGVDADRSLRLSVGWSTSDADIEAFAAAFPRVVADLRALRS